MTYLACSLRYTINKINTNVFVMEHEANGIQQHHGCDRFWDMLYCPRDDTSTKRMGNKDSIVESMVMKHSLYITYSILHGRYLLNASHSNVGLFHAENRCTKMQQVMHKLDVGQKARANSMNENDGFFGTITIFKPVYD